MPQAACRSSAWPVETGAIVTDVDAARRAVHRTRLPGRRPHRRGQDVGERLPRSSTTGVWPQRPGRAAHLEPGRDGEFRPDPVEELLPRALVQRSGVEVGRGERGHHGPGLGRVRADLTARRPGARHAGQRVACRPGVTARRRGARAAGGGQASCTARIAAGSGDPITSPALDRRPRRRGLGGPRPLRSGPKYRAGTPLPPPPLRPRAPGRAARPPARRARRPCRMVASQPVPVGLTSSGPSPAAITVVEPLSSTQQP